MPDEIGWLDFEQAVEQMLECDPLICSEEDLAVLGGEFEADRLTEFLGAWNFAEMPYRVWEYAHGITFNESEVREPALLERGRIFGEGGDLSLRRDGVRLLWNFTGAAGTPAPSGFDARNFWREGSVNELRHHDATALLWGDYRDERQLWHDDRVGWAELSYPCVDAGALVAGERLSIGYTAFSDGGQTALIWWKELRRYGEGND